MKVQYGIKLVLNTTAGNILREFDFSLLPSRPVSFRIDRTELIAKFQYNLNGSAIIHECVMEDLGDRWKPRPDFRELTLSPLLDFPPQIKETARI
jgi:hypothetical protein